MHHSVPEEELSKILVPDRFRFGGVKYPLIYLLGDCNYRVVSSGLNQSKCARYTLMEAALL